MTEPDRRGPAVAGVAVAEDWAAVGNQAEACAEHSDRIRAIEQRNQRFFRAPPRSAKPQGLSAMKEAPSGREQLGTGELHGTIGRTRHARAVASIDEAACTLCGACQAVCPIEAITLGEVVFYCEPGGPAVDVGACLKVCPAEAISLS